LTLLVTRPTLTPQEVSVDPRDPRWPYASYGPVFSTDDQLYAAAGTWSSIPTAWLNLVREEFANFIQHDYRVTTMTTDERRRCGGREGLGRSGSTVCDRRVRGGVLTAWIVAARIDSAPRRPRNRDQLGKFRADHGHRDVCPEVLVRQASVEDPRATEALSVVARGNVTTPTLVVVGERTTVRP